MTPLVPFVEPETLDNIPALEWEKTQSFMQNEGTKHNLPKLLSCGLFSHKSQPYMVATPGNVLPKENVHILSGDRRHKMSIFCLR